ncbi:MAG: DNA-binding protein [Acetobacter peroxydans]|nr:DNA-binding protein [Acetobacter peroxydans]MCI2077573.1 DNA-binding protein [Acetobacter peroxydans]
MGTIAHFPVHRHKETVAPLVVSEAKAAAMVGLAPRTLQSKRLDGSGPVFVQLTKRRIGYSVQALREWVANRSVSSTADATARFGGVA